MKKTIAIIFLRLIGWKIRQNHVNETTRSVMLAAPHTSNWDFPIALAACWYLGINVKYLIKDDYTRGPMGWFFKWSGAIGVNRKRRRNNLVEYGIELLRENKERHLMVPAEGTRKRVDKWRTGFYRIAREADVPVTLGFLDYKKKEGGILDVIHLSGDFEKDMYKIQEAYRPVTGKFPENYNPEIY